MLNPASEHSFAVFGHGTNFYFCS